MVLRDFTAISSNHTKAQKDKRKRAQDISLREHWNTVFVHVYWDAAAFFFFRINSVIRKRVFFLWPKDWHLFHIFFVRGTYVGSITLYSLCFKLTAEILYSYWLGIITHMICWTCVQCITMENIVLREYVRRNRWPIIYKHH